MTQRQTVYVRDGMMTLAALRLFHRKSPEEQCVLLACARQPMMGFSFVRITDYAIAIDDR
jgi:hypothetical protein